jgi:hypothetical protein
VILYSFLIYRKSIRKREEGKKARREEGKKLKSE